MSQAVDTTVFVADNTGFTTNNIALGVDDIDLGGDLEYAISTGKRGTRQQYACRSRIVAERIQRGFSIKPTAAEMDWILERAIGDNIGNLPSSAVVPGETVPAWFLWANKGNEQTFQYTNCRFNSLSLAGSELAEMVMRAELVGTAEVEVTDLVSPPAVDCDNQFIFSDCSLTIGGTAYGIKSLNLSMDNLFGDGQYENNTQRSIFESQSLAMTLEIITAYRSDTSALYRRGISGDVGILTMNDGVVEYNFTFANTKAPTQGPVVPVVGEVTMGLTFAILRTESNPMVSIEKTV